MPSSDQGQYEPSEPRLENPLAQTRIDDSFRELLRILGDSVGARLAAQGFRWDIIDDAIQDTFLKVLDGRLELKLQPEEIVPYLKAVVRNTCVDYVRTRDRTHTLSEEIQSRAEVPADEIPAEASRDRAEAVQREAERILGLYLCRNADHQKVLRWWFWPPPAEFPPAGPPLSAKGVRIVSNGIVQEKRGGHWIVVSRESGSAPATCYRIRNAFLADLRRCSRV